MKNGNSKGPNITDSKVLFEHEYEHKNAKVTVKKIDVDNPANSPAPGKRGYLEIRNWYWNNAAQAWMPAKGVWMARDNEEDHTTLVRMATAILEEVQK